MRHAFRSLLKSPGFTAIALLTLALGIGVNTSMFSIVDALLFRKAPYPESDRLVQLDRHISTGRLFFGRFSVQELRELETNATEFSSFTAFDRVVFTLSEPGQPAERHLAIRFTSGVIETLRVNPLLGRVFTADDFRPGRSQVVLITESAWRSRFGADPNIVGRTLRLDGEMVTIIGVLPARHEYRQYWGGAAFWRPLEFTPDQLNFRGYRQFWIVGRLKPAASPTTLLAELAPLAAQQEKEHPQEYPSLRYGVTSLPEAAIDDVRRTMSWMLLGLSGFVLLIACANLANLQLARATASVREFAVRAALGASRRRLITQQLTESVLLSVAGGALGLLVAVWINSLAERVIVADGGSLDATLHAGVLLAALLVSLLTGMAFGILPALLASRADLLSALKTQTRGSTVSRGQQRLRHALIVGEIALALILLGGAALINRGFARMLERNTGWDTDRVLTAILPIPEPRYPTAAQRVDFFRKLEDRLAAIPGVESAALSTSMPLLNFSTDRQVFIDAPAADGAATNPVAWHYMITADYFAAMGIRLLEGRTFPRDLQPDGPPYIVVNETLARRFWPNDTAVGKRLGGIHEGQPVWREIIGVVNDVEPAASLEHPTTRLAVYRPLVQEPWSYVNVVLRAAPTHPNVDTLAQPLRRAISDTDPDLAADAMLSVRRFTAATQSNVVLVGKTLVGFAALGLGLAAIGLYGVISHLVALRTSEFGIRLALGAQPRDVLADVLRRGLRLATIGLVLGLAGAWGLGRLLASFMPRLAMPDPVGLAGVALLLFTVALVACWLPARRATRVDPLSALRAE
jgi:putative ABC transport system permease protein